jgi:uncharacterized membrane protein YqjE
VLEALPRLAPALLRHFAAYVELVADETGDALRQWRRQAIGLAVIAFAGAMALLMGCVWVIAANWDGPHRGTAPALLCVIFVLVALAAWIWLRSASVAPAPFSRLRAELQEDRELVAQLEDPQPRGDSVPPEVVAQVHYGGYGR